MIEDQVQVIIASTNGIHYTDRINKLTSYPRYSLPIKPTSKENALMLDIGCGWGRWLVAGTEKNYIPVGLDLIPEFAETSLKVLKAHNKTGYAVVGDLEHIPFKDNIFDLVWSFSVIQHTHYDKMISCLGHINRILTKEGYTFLEFPNKMGIRNALGTARKWEKYRDIKSGPRHLSVRYYTPAQYKKFFTSVFGNFSFENHSFIGIGVLKEDLKYVSLKNKILCSISLAGSLLTVVIPPLKYLSDSIYIKAVSNISKSHHSFNDIIKFLSNQSAGSFNNLDVVPLLRCPKSGFGVELSADQQKIIVPKAGLWYPIQNNIPHMLADKAGSL